MKRNTYFFVAFSVGKWTQKTCNALFEQVFERMELPFPYNKIEFFTDGNDDYTYVLPKYYAETCMNYGQLVKIREKGTVVDKERRIIFGSVNERDIETTVVENFNGILRERNGRLVRKTKCFSKQKIELENHLHLFQFYWNFINNFKRGYSPAMLEGITNHIWSWREFFYFRLGAIS